jgi:hypothetical protein
MLKQLRKINKLLKNNILIWVIIFLIYLLCFFYVKSIYIIFIFSILVVYLANKDIDNKYIRFLSDVSGIILIAYLFIICLNLSFLNIDIEKYFRVLLKFVLLIDFIIIIFYFIQNKLIQKNKKRNKLKKYTFKELRIKHIEEFKEKNKKLIDNYIKNENITTDSEYYKLINDNFENKSKFDLEEYVWMNYLRFYKNKK